MKAATAINNHFSVVSGCDLQHNDGINNWIARTEFFTNRTKEHAVKHEVPGSFQCIYIGEKHVRLGSRYREGGRYHLQSSG
jgi:hypothetical protein